MSEDLVQEPQSESHSTGPRYRERGEIDISPALRERLIEAGWTPPPAKFEEAGDFTDVPSGMNSQ